MSLFAWTTRRAAGLAMIALLWLCYWVISKDAISSGAAGIWTDVFAYYCLAIHLITLGFPIRACWSIYDITQSLKCTSRSKSHQEIELASSRRNSSVSVSDSQASTFVGDNSTIASSASSEADDSEISIYSSDGQSDDVIHAIILPNYKEEVEVLRETLDVLSSHSRARYMYDIYLAMEQREQNVEVKALSLIQEYVKKFRSLDFTVHPPNLPGDSPGKGSNVAWAARKLSERYSMDLRRKVIVTVIDADSHLMSNYFAHLTSMHLSHPDTALTTLYAAPIVFDRNADDVPAIVRAADILWAAAGMSGLYHGSCVAPPTSVYSLPLQLVDRVGGWDCDGEAIGEDLHMYLKCFFALNGHLTVRTIMSPVSQTDVSGNGYLQSDLRARYKQALRHMWGTLDSAFTMRKIVEVWRERKHTERAFRPLHVALAHPGANYDSQVRVDSEEALESGIFSDVTTDTLKNPDWMRMLTVAHRMFEAGFLPVQMTIMVIASSIYVYLVQDSPERINLIMDTCNILRTLGFLGVFLYLFLHEGFYRFNVSLRVREMQEAGLSQSMQVSRRGIKNLTDYIVSPLVAPIYAAIPTAQAQICHFWTLELVYAVSKKSARQSVPLRAEDGPK